MGQCFTNPDAGGAQDVARGINATDSTQPHVKGQGQGEEKGEKGATKHERDPPSDVGPAPGSVGDVHALQRRELDGTLLKGNDSKAMKKRCRQGIPDSFRKRYWLRATDADLYMVANPKAYEKAHREAFPSRKRMTWRDYPEIPTFGNAGVESSEAARKATRRDVRRRHMSISRSRKKELQKNTVLGAASASSSELKNVSSPGSDLVSAKSSASTPANNAPSEQKGSADDAAAAAVASPSFAASDAPSPISAGQIESEAREASFLAAAARWADAHRMSPNDVSVMNEMLCVLGHHFPSVKYCPLLPEIIALTSRYLSTEESYAVSVELLQRSESDGWYFQQTTVRSAVFAQTFIRLVAEKNSKLYSHVHTTLKHDLLDTVSSWFSRMFVGYLSLEHIYRLLDTYFIEGYKVLYRVGLAILQQATPVLLGCSTIASFDDSLKKFCLYLKDIDALLDVAFGLFLRRRKFAKIDGQHEVSSLAMPDVPSRVLRWPTYNEKQSDITTMEHLLHLWTWLPERAQTNSFHRLFSTESDGFSLITLLNQCENRGSLVIFIKDKSGNVFGAFVPGDMTRSLKQKQNRKVIIFTLYPEERHHTWNQNDATDIFVTFSTEQLAIGDVSSRAIYLTGDLDIGSSTKTAGFESKALVPNATGDFHVRTLEVWGFKDIDY